MIPDNTILDQEFSSVHAFLDAAGREFHGLAAKSDWFGGGGAAIACSDYRGFGSTDNGFNDWPGEHPERPYGDRDTHVAVMDHVIATLRRPGGSPIARQRVREYLHANCSAARSRQPRRRMQWSGRPDGELSIDRLYSGRLDTAFRVPGVAAVPSAPRVRIGIQAGAPFTVRDSAMAARGAVCAAIAAEAYAMGCRVSLDWCSRANFYNKNRRDKIGRPYSLTVRLVGEGQPVDVDRIADVCASAYMQRALVLSLNRIFDQNSVPDKTDPDGFDIFAGQAALDNPRGWLDAARAKLKAIAK